MPQRNAFFAGGELLNSLVCKLDEAQTESIKITYGNAALDGIFANGELMTACLSLFENDLNVSLTASKLYMHRNTLIYGINKIKRLSGLDLRKFSDAVTFAALYAIKTKDKS